MGKQKVISRAWAGECARCGGKGSLHKIDSRANKRNSEDPRGINQKTGTYSLKLREKPVIIVQRKNFCSQQGWGAVTYASDVRKPRLKRHIPWGVSTINCSEGSPNKLERERKRRPKEAVTSARESQEIKKLQKREARGPGAITREQKTEERASSNDPRRKRCKRGR